MHCMEGQTERKWTNVTVTASKQVKQPYIKNTSSTQTISSA